MATPTTNPRGRISVDLGKSLQVRLNRLAKKSTTTPTSLSRLLVHDGIERMEAGEIEVSGPFLQRKGKGSK